MNSYKENKRPWFIFGHSSKEGDATGEDDNSKTTYIVSACAVDLFHNYVTIKVPMQRNIRLCFHDPAWYFLMR